ncbi:MAG TPA: aminotransferase class I/II-fold pyridoxal phosphate-dependent enzyme [Gaiellaceae bacterium]|nr:aminotransferase class I/II-fold pyridoxal phosphate-dependent enzyme [Gaiellaceae bacterium]
MTQFRRVDALPPYAFAEVERLKLELRREGRDVIDFGFGNPDVAPPELAVEKLREAALLPRNHRYSASRGLPNLRKAICERYAARYGVELDPETEATMSLGAKEGLVHLLWVLLGPGDVALVPSPSYPIHLFAPGFAGAAVQRVPVGPDVDFVAGVKEAWELSQPRPRVLLCSFPHNPTTAIADLSQMQQLVDFAREKEMVLVHDFAYADLAFDGYRPSSIFEADGAREVAVELYSLTKGFSVAGWRVAFVLGRSDVIGALARLKSYLDYGSFQPLQIAATVALREAADYPAEVAEVYRGRRDALCDGLARIGWDVPRPAATMFVWARIPDAFAAEGAQAFAVRLLREAHVAVSPGSGFGVDGEGFVRFALVENEQRIAQAVRGLRGVLS